MISFLICKMGIMIIFPGVIERLLSDTATIVLFAKVQGAAFKTQNHERKVVRKEFSSRITSKSITLKQKTEQFVLRMVDFADKSISHLTLNSDKWGTAIKSEGLDSISIEILQMIEMWTIPAKVCDRDKPPVLWGDKLWQLSFLVRGWTKRNQIL